MGDLDAWAAGIFEGEGTVTQNSSGRPRLAIKMTDYDVLLQFQAVMGGYLRGPYQGQGNRKPHWMWYSSTRETKECVERMWPYLMSRRRERVLRTGIVDWEYSPLPPATVSHETEKVSKPMELLGTTSVTVRLPNPVVEYIDESEWANRSEFLRHWANVGWRVSRDPELSEALEWALDREVQDPLPVVIVPVTGYEVPNVDGSPRQNLDDGIHAVEEIHEAQLEEMRNRLR